MDSINPRDQKTNVVLLKAAYAEFVEPQEFPVLRASRVKSATLAVVCLLFIAQFIALYYLHKNDTEQAALPTAEQETTADPGYEETDSVANAIKEIDRIEKQRQLVAAKLDQTRQQLRDIEEKINETTQLINMAKKTPLAKLGVNLTELNQRLERFNQERQKILADSRSLDQQMKALEARARDIGQLIPRAR